jgi:hypothetical protein
MHNKSINVKRSTLLEKLYENRNIHRKEYEEALVEFKARLQEDLKTISKRVNKTENVEDLKELRVSISFPQNHETDYNEVIEMMEASVDETINLDSQSFKAYFKNEWPWAQQFRLAKASYVTAGSTMSIG